MASPPAPSRAERLPSAGRPATRRGNWWALGLGTLLGGFGVLGYAAGSGEGDGGGMLLALSFAASMAALFVVAYVSGRGEGWRRALQAGLVMLLIALPTGLLSRLTGAALGFAVGVVITLNPPRFTHVFRNRLLAVLLASSYALVLLMLLPPAGVMTAALMPPLIVGLADEYTAWRSQNRG